MRFVMKQHVPAQHRIVQEFYSDVKNLKRISPPFPRLTVHADNTHVVEGRNVLLGLDFILFRIEWFSRIDEVVEGKHFVDTFHGSLFSSWRHTHAYESSGEGTLLTDEIECSTPGWFAPIAYIGVKALFMFRRRAIAQVLV